MGASKSPMEHMHSLARELTLPNLVGVVVIFVVSLARSVTQLGAG